MGTATTVVPVSNRSDTASARYLAPSALTVTILFSGSLSGIAGVLGVVSPSRVSAATATRSPLALRRSP